MSTSTSDRAWRALFDAFRERGEGSSDASPSSASDQARASVELVQLLRGQEDDAAAKAERDRILAMLRQNASPADRFVVVREIGRGGMGVVQEVYDPELDRHVARKLQLGDPEATDPLRRLVFERRRDRMLEEGQIMSQLDDPGVVPLHELGMDESGRLFLIMPLVRGSTFAATLRRVHERQAGWTLSRALALFERAVRIIGHAHERGVVHRDLKPDNLLVGDAGEVRWVDWGLSKALGDDAPDAGSDPHHGVTTFRGGRTGSGSSPLYTREGEVLGTPAFMPPERASRSAAIDDRRADIYGLGAILYQLLSGHAPYADLDPDGRSPSARTVLAALERQPPSELTPSTARGTRELHAVCARAMAREPERRYATAEELADDLRALREHRTAQAFAASPLRRARKWLRRNALATASIAVPLALLLAFGLPLFVDLLRERTEAESAQRTAETLQREADAEERRARERLELLQGLEVALELGDLRRVAGELWPAVPETLPALHDWVGRGEAVAERLASLERLDTLSGDSLQLSALERVLVDRALGPLLVELRRFVHGETPLEGSLGVTGSSLPDLQRRRALIERTARECATPSVEHASWDELIEDVARPASPYGGLVARPRAGLVPLGRDQESGLWELWHVASGDAPARDAEGRFVVTPQTGLVFVLIPGGSARIGAQSDAPRSPHFDPDTDPGEGPPFSVELDAFYLSKYELTQAQWKRMSGRAVSVYTPEAADHDGTVPVESVSWQEGRDLFAAFDLVLPTEAQWEHAGRGGQPFAPWCVGNDPSALEQAANLADKSLLTRRPFDTTHEEWDDGYSILAPVGRFLPNGYGLHDIHGNVREWCLDDLHMYADVPARGGDGLRQEPGPNGKVVRGSSHLDIAETARLTQRNSFQADHRASSLGLRPAMRITNGMR